MINLVNFLNHTSRPILESKGLHVIFQKNGKKCLKRAKRAKYWKIEQKYTKFKNILKRAR